MLAGVAATTAPGGLHQKPTRSASRMLQNRLRRGRQSRLISAHVTLLPSAFSSVMSRQARRVSSVLMLFNRCILKLTTCPAGRSDFLFLIPFERVIPSFPVFQQNPDIILVFILMASSKGTTKISNLEFAEPSDGLGRRCKLDRASFPVRTQRPLEATVLSVLQQGPLAFICGVCSLCFS